MERPTSYLDLSKAAFSQKLEQHSLVYLDSGFCGQVASRLIQNFRHYCLCFLSATLSVECPFSFELFLLPTSSCFHLALAKGLRLSSAFSRRAAEKRGIVVPALLEDLAPAASAFTAAAFAR